MSNDINLFRANGRRTARRAVLSFNGEVLGEQVSLTGEGTIITLPPLTWFDNTEVVKPTERIVQFRGINTKDGRELLMTAGIGDPGIKVLRVTKEVKPY